VCLFWTKYERTGALDGFINEVNPPSDVTLSMAVHPRQLAGPSIRPMSAEADGANVGQHWPFNPNIDTMQPLLTLARKHTIYRSIHTTTTLFHDK
jgi:hypothetical protein